LPAPFRLVPSSRQRSRRLLHLDGPRRPGWADVVSYLPVARLAQPGQDLAAVARTAHRAPADSAPAPLRHRGRRGVPLPRGRVGQPATRLPPPTGEPPRPRFLGVPTGGRGRPDPLAGALPPRPGSPPVAAQDSSLGGLAGCLPVFCFPRRRSP